MVDQQVFAWLLDSLKDPVIFVDTEHVIRYMNKAALEAHEGRPSLIGHSLFDCHCSSSNAMVIDFFSRLQEGEEEILVSDSPPQRIFMRSVRDDRGALMGYYERFETSVPG